MKLLPRYDSPPEYAAGRPFERHRLWHLSIWAHDDSPDWFPEWAIRSINRLYCLAHGHTDDSYGGCAFCFRKMGTQ